MSHVLVDRRSVREVSCPTSCNNNRIFLGQLWVGWLESDKSEQQCELKDPNLTEILSVFHVDRNFVLCVCCDISSAND